MPNPKILEPVPPAVTYPGATEMHTTHGRQSLYSRKRHPVIFSKEHNGPWELTHFEGHAPDFHYELPTSDEITLGAVVGIGSGNLTSFIATDYATTQGESGTVLAFYSSCPPALSMPKAVAITLDGEPQHLRNIQAFPSVVDMQTNDDKHPSFQFGISATLPNENTISIIYDSSINEVVSRERYLSTYQVTAMSMKDDQPYAGLDVTAFDPQSAEMLWWPKPHGAIYRIALSDYPFLSAPAIVASYSTSQTQSHVHFIGPVKRDGITYRADMLGHFLSTSPAETELNTTLVESKSSGSDDAIQATRFSGGTASLYGDEIMLVDFSGEFICAITPTDPAITTFNSLVPAAYYEYGLGRPPEFSHLVAVQVTTRIDGTPPVYSLVYFNSTCGSHEGCRNQFTADHTPRESLRYDQGTQSGSWPESEPLEIRDLTGYFDHGKPVDLHTDPSCGLGKTAAKAGIFSPSTPQSLEPDVSHALGFNAGS